jgi:hypothetical protein
MLSWLRKKAEAAQRKNVERTLEVLVQVSNKADAQIERSGRADPADQKRVVSLQRALLNDLIGPASVEQLEEDYLKPLMNDPEASEGAKLAVEHVFKTARQ